MSDTRDVPARVLGSLLAQAKVLADYKFLAEHCGITREDLEAANDQANSERYATMSGAVWSVDRDTASDDGESDKIDARAEMNALKELFGSAHAATARVRFLDSLRSDLSECNSAIA